ncbi:MAG: ATP-dependent helicase, partial [Terriglobia bacterium]
FQDTNAAQWELLKLLAGQRRNIAVVGDDYQAIYRFRGASNGSLDQFQGKDFSDCRSIVLNWNYRSANPILQVADATARGLSSYRLEKQLIPNDRDRGRAVMVAEFASVEQQAEWVAAELEAGLARYKLAREKADQPEPQSPLFAVLYRAHLHRAPLVAALQRRGIPFVIRNLAVNSLPPIRNLMAYLRAIGRPEDTVSLIRVLADPQWGLAVLQLIAYCRAARNRRVPLRAVIEEDEAGWAGRQRLLALLERYRKLAEQDRLVAWLEALRLELRLRGDAASDAALQTFSGFVEKWDREKSQAGMLAEFLEYLSYFEEAGGVVALPEEGDDETAAGDAVLLRAQESVAAEQLSLLEEAPKTAASQKVQLMSVHAAKGLEFENVFLFHLVRGAFPVRNRKPLISLPDELWKGPLLAGDFHAEEERRLFYVALTRARSSLTLCTVSNDRQRPSPFLQE